MSVVVDSDLCEANEVCVGLCPEVFRLGADDRVTILRDPIPENLRPAVEKAVSSCPRQALSLRDRDPGRQNFPDADTFDIGRTPNAHVAFGIGEHFCLGSNLARLELNVMFEELLRRIPEIQLAGEPRRLRSNFINAIKYMPVRFGPR